MVWRDVGKLFQRWGAATENERKPYDFSLYDFDVSSNFDDERRFRAGLYIVIKSSMYEGVTPCRHLNTTRQILYFIRSSIGSQCKLISRGVIWSCFFDKVIRRAAAFWTDCRLQWYQNIQIFINKT